MGDKFFWGGFSTWGINDQIMPRVGEFTNAFSSNLKTVYNPEFFGNHEGIYT